MENIKLKSCPFCGDKMKITSSLLAMKKNDAVVHQERNNKCPVGVGIYRLDIWQQRTGPDSGFDLKPIIDDECPF